MSKHETSFFIGWAQPEGSVWRSFVLVAAVFIAVFSGAAFLTAATQSDPGDGTFRWDWGRQMVVGTLTEAPYPTIHVETSEKVPEGTTILLSGVGKRGVQGRSAPLDGKRVAASGVFLTRGDLTMLQVRGGAEGLSAAQPNGAGAASPSSAPTPVPLGRWRLTGEICDGKCYAGAMRPGTGLAHKACANLCLVGGVPPVFVSTAPVDGEVFFLMGSSDGGPVTDVVLGHTATRVSVEGEVERRGSLPVFLIDPDSIEIVR
ncbi:MAG: hypothetical protein AAGJ94_01235 [Pseudomonadota bacterium]